MKNFFPPQDKNFRYLQTNRSDTLGSLWSSFNLDFQSNLGRMRLGRKLVTNTTTTNDADLGLPVAFELFDERWFAVCGTRVFKNTDEFLTTAFTEDASTGAQTDYDPLASDLAVFNDRLWSTTTDNLYSKAAGSGTGTWTSRDALGLTSVHQMAYFKKFDRLYYVNNDDTINSIDTADAVANSAGDYYLDLDVDVTEDITCMVAGADSIWIGTKRIHNSSSLIGLIGHIYQWDGISSQITREYTVGTAGVLAMCIIEDIPYAVDTEGRILQYVGSSFKEIQRLPIRDILLFASTSSSQPPIHFNGMIATKDNTILIAVNNVNEDTASTINENLPSGIWELDLATLSLTHKHSFSLKAVSSSTITDFGQNRIVNIGAIKMNTFDHAFTVGRSPIIAGATYYTTATVSQSGIFLLSPYTPTTENEGQKRGYFVTTWFDSLEVTDLWGRIWVTYRRFLNSADKITLKYRTTEEAPTYATITWVDTTHFTTTTDVSAYGPTATGFNGSTGGEVEILQGVGSGACVHITSVVNNAGTYTVTLDTAVTGATTTTAKARFQKWIKLFPEITGQTVQFAQVDINFPDTRIQVKGVMEFTGDDEFHRMAIASSTNLNILTK